MAKVSVLIPAVNEEYLKQTVDSVLDNATGDVECIVWLDGYAPDSPLKEDPRLRVIYSAQTMGMRAGVNECARAATGRYIMKLDAHCLLSEGYDEALQEGLDDCDVVTPRRDRLDKSTWTFTTARGKPTIDYMYLYCPKKDPALYPNDPTWYFRGCHWGPRDEARRDVPIDDNMFIQGSTYFCTRQHFTDRIGFLKAEHYGQVVQEASEVVLQTWLGPWHGRVLINKKVRYAHWHRPTNSRRPYYLSKSELLRAHRYAADYWLNNRWAGRGRDFEWLIDHFAPVPSWPDDWKTRDWAHMLDAGDVKCQP